MVPATSMTPGTAPGVLVAEVSFRPVGPEERRFTRADLVFFGVDHSHTSYEVRVFLNNPKADASTPRTAEHGYAGRFVVFGHGGCFGDEGHCDVPSEPRGSTDLRLTHPLTAQTKLVTVTDALRRVLAEQEEGLSQVTLVPISKDPSQEQRRPTDSLFRFDGFELQTYLTETEEVSTSV
jgi:tyrosinase